VNLSKIESRPRVGSPWEYIFFVEVDGHIEDEQNAAAVKGLKDYTIYLKHLGSYPKAG
jgi:chorismate mutase/prephenate dehydratase